LLSDTKLAIDNGGLGPAWHTIHVRNYPMPEIKPKEPHLGKYFLKVPQMGKFAYLYRYMNGGWLVTADNVLQIFLFSSLVTFGRLFGLNVIIQA